MLDAHKNLLRQFGILTFRNQAAIEKYTCPVFGSPCIFNICSRLSRSSTGRVSSNRLSLVGPTKVKARKSFLFTEGSPVITQLCTTNGVKHE